MVSVTIPALTRLLCPIRWHRCRPFQPRLPLNAVGRSFGDFLLKAELNKPQWKQVGHPLKKRWTLSCQVISPVPQIEQYKLQPGWEFILVATDGVAPSPSPSLSYNHDDAARGVGRDVKQRRGALCSFQAAAGSTSSPVATQRGRCCWWWWWVDLISIAERYS